MTIMVQTLSSWRLLIHVHSPLLRVRLVREEHSKRVLGWSVADHMFTELVTDVLAQAVAVRGGQVGGTSMGSDRGAQYTARAMVAACADGGLRRSMGATGMLVQHRRGIAVVDVQTRVLLPSRLRDEGGTRCSS